TGQLVASAQLTTDLTAIGWLADPSNTGVGGQTSNVGIEPTQASGVGAVLDQLDRSSKPDTPTVVAGSERGGQFGTGRASVMTNSRRVRESGLWTARTSR